MVSRWPAWEIDLLDKFFEREPASIDRVEMGIARLTAMYVAAHQRSGGRLPAITDFLPHLKAWPFPQDGRYSDVDREIMQVML